jgi:Flp pilus assembly protein TadD
MQTGMQMNRFSRALALAVLAGIALSGCNTTSATSTHAATDATLTSAVERQDLGVDSHGQPIGASWPTIPASNQASLKGDSSQELLQRGKEHFRGDNFGLAESNFRKAVEVRPDSVEAWAGLAASYDQLGRFDLADRAYDQLLKLKKNDARIMNNRGYSFLLRGDYAKAESWFKKAQAANPVLEEVDGNLHLLEKVRQG